MKGQRMSGSVKPRRVAALVTWYLALLAVLGTAGLAGEAMAQAPAGGEKHISVSLVPESLTPAAGTTTTLAISMRPQPGWHGYWRTPGDTGLAAKASWTLPAGVTAGDPAYPVPGMLVIDGLMNHVYDKPYALLVPLTLPRGLVTGTKLPVHLKLTYLVCTEQVCVPEIATVATDLTVGDGAADPAVQGRFAAWRKALPRPLGGEGRFAVEKGRFRLAVPVPAGVTLKTPHLFVENQDAVSFAAPQTFSRNGDTLIIETAAGAAAPALFKGVLDIGDGAGIDIVARPGAVPAAGSSIAGQGGSAGQSVLMLTLVSFAGAMLGGLILNVMPCVFPILSLKALSLARSGEDHGAARREAVAYAAGVIVVCVGLGALILALRAAGDQVGWAFQLQKPGVIFGLILLAGAIGFNLAGLFEFSAMTAGSDLASKSGAAGAFWTGALAAFVATPCTGPFMAAALGVALVLPLAAALLVFVGLGLGLALPFLAIGFIPALRRRLPKPGAWMNTFRHVLAVPMFVTSVGLAWVLGNQVGANGIVVSLIALLVLTLGLWAMGLRQRAMKGGAWIPATAAALLAIGIGLMLPGAEARDQARSAPIAGVERFDPVRLAALRAANTPVFLYMTADWCLSCKVNEKAAIERSETREAYAKAGVVTMVGDWTDGNAAISTFLETHGRSGVPLYLWYAPGKEAQVLPQILTPGFLAGLAKQTGKT